MASSKKITLQCSDNETFEVDEVVALESKTLRHLIEEGRAESIIPLPNVSSKILAIVIEFCKMRSQFPEPPDDDIFSEVLPVDDALKKFEADFISGEQAILLDLILAANYLDIKGLLNLACKKVSRMIVGKTGEEIRNMFKIENGLTADEMEEARRENQWTFR